MSDTEIVDVTAEVSTRDGVPHTSTEFQLLVTGATSEGHEPPAIADADVVLLLSDGDARTRITLSDEQARRVAGQLGLSLGGDA